MKIFGEFNSVSSIVQEQKLVVCIHTYQLKFVVAGSGFGSGVVIVRDVIGKGEVEEEEHMKEEGYAEISCRVGRHGTNNFRETLEALSLFLNKRDPKLLLLLLPLLGFERKRRIVCVWICNESVKRGNAPTRGKGILVLGAEGRVCKVRTYT